MTTSGYPLMLYVDSDPRLRRLADVTFRGEYIVESIASVDDMDGIDSRLEPVVAVVNLSESTDPSQIWDRLCQQWPTVPAVMVLTIEAAIEQDREVLWALGPASIVVNPFSGDAMRRGVATALS